jgi:Xaa-Pro aminopeptidase
VKEPGEVELIAAAAELNDGVYRWVLERGLAGRTERDVARACEAQIRELGAEPSFPPIVAAGENGAIPHADAGDREIGSGELVVFDMGAKLDGYYSDGTRTFATGEPGEEAREVYDLVLTAQLAALGAIRAGATGKEIDAVAREIIAEAGHGDQFGHGLGHGVGLDLHEGPRLATTSEEELREGNVVTVEPGIYLPGRFGVRIEDLVVLTADGHRNLSGMPKELPVVD